MDSETSLLNPLSLIFDALNWHFFALWWLEKPKKV